jgi:hypothetical protein
VPVSRLRSHARSTYERDLPMVWEIMLNGGQRSVQTDNATPETYGIVVTQRAPGGGGEVETIHPWQHRRVGQAVQA